MERRAPLEPDTRPTADVTVRLHLAPPRPDTPASVSVSPSTFVFRPSAWSASQVLMATVSVGDDAVDSAQDVEDFTLTHAVSTADAVYAAKASNLTVVVRVQDDDTAGIVFPNEDSTRLLYVP